MVKGCVMPAFRRCPHALEKTLIAISGNRIGTFYIRTPSDPEKGVYSLDLLDGDKAKMNDWLLGSMRSRSFLGGSR